MACQLAERVGIKVKQVLTHDDISAGIGADIKRPSRLGRLCAFV